MADDAVPKPGKRGSYKKQAAFYGITGRNI
jgi:hypothetical protein